MNYATLSVILNKYNTIMFPEDLNIDLMKRSSDTVQSNLYNKLTEIFTKTLGEHEPKKGKVIRGNHAPVMKK